MTLAELVESCNINSKELREVEAFYKIVFPFFEEHGIHPEVFHDLCCGNGLLGMYIAMKTGKTVVSSDWRQTTKYKRLRKAVGDAYDLINHSFQEANLWDDSDESHLTEDTALVSIHACGHLTDRVIELGLKYKVPFAVMPCCHKDIPPYFILSDMPLKDCSVRLFHDRVRLRYIREQGFTAHYLNIPRRISPYNRIIIGVNN